MSEPDKQPAPPKIVVYDDFDFYFDGWSHSRTVVSTAGESWEETPEEWRFMLRGGETVRVFKAQVKAVAHRNRVVEEPAEPYIPQDQRKKPKKSDGTTLH